MVAQGVAVERVGNTLSGLGGLGQERGSGRHADAGRVGPGLRRSG